MVLVELIGVLIVALSIVYIYYKLVIFNFWCKRDVFYVKPIVLVGNIIAFLTGAKQIGVLFQNIYMQYKEHRIIGTYAFFKPNLVIADLDLIRTVLTKEFESFHDRGMYCNEKIDPLSGHLILLSGKKWRNLRVKLTPTFTSGKLKQMFSVLKECSEKFAKFLESKAQMRDFIEGKDIFTRYTTDVIMSTAFGIKSNCIEEPNNEYRKVGNKIFEIHPFWTAVAASIPQIMDYFSIPLIDRHVTNFFINMFKKNVEYRQTHNIIRYDFMNLLIQLMDRGYVKPDDDKEAINNLLTVNKLTMTEATAQSFVFFAGGFETSSTTATFALYELALNQDVQDKVRREINKILAKYGEVTYDALNEMTYLEKVINETLRKYPPIPFLIRVCTKEINLTSTNIRLPKGTFITIPVLGLYRDPSIYPNPDKFDPERFNADVIAERHPYAYLPFGKGPRTCIAMRFGYMQTKMGLVNLLTKYIFTLHPQTQVPLIFDERRIILSAKGGVHLIIESR